MSNFDQIARIYWAQNLFSRGHCGGLNSGEIQSLVVAMCSKEEQIEVNKLVESRLLSIDRLEKDISIQLLKAERNKQSILSEAFSGGLY